MGNIVPFLRERVFDPQDIQAMSMALDEVCAALNLPAGDNQARRAIAERIIALAGRGERNAMKLRDRVLREAAVPLYRTSELKSVC
jgi:hypothetical protein